MIGRHGLTKATEGERRPDQIMTALFEANRELGDISGFDATSRDVDSDLKQATLAELQSEIEVWETILAFLVPERRNAKNEQEVNIEYSLKIAKWQGSISHTAEVYQQYVFRLKKPDPVIQEMNVLVTEMKKAVRRHTLAESGLVIAGIGYMVVFVVFLLPKRQKPVPRVPQFE